MMVAVVCVLFACGLCVVGCVVRVRCNGWVARREWGGGMHMFLLNRLVQSRYLCVDLSMRFSQLIACDGIALAACAGPNRAAGVISPKG